jgi:hypothetical protein
MNADLFLAILAMDSYNRGYDQGIRVTRGGNAIGAAFLIDQSDVETNSIARQIGFYARAYNWVGKKVISYRGTSTSDISATLDDVFSGWTIGAGYSEASQAVTCHDPFPRLVAKPCLGSSCSRLPSEMHQSSMSYAFASRKRPMPMHNLNQRSR